MSPLLLYGAAALAGALTNVAVGMNQSLGRGLQQIALSAVVVQATGLVVLVGVLLLRGVAVPGAATLAGVPWWAWLGGAVQALTLFAVFLAAQSAGAVLFSALTVSAGTIAAVVLDHYGLLGFAVRELTWTRVAGCALLIGGAVLVARG